MANRTPLGTPRMTATPRVIPSTVTRPMRRYKGARSLHRKIRAAVRGGPQQLVTALNATLVMDQGQLAIDDARVIETLFVESSIPHQFLVTFVNKQPTYFLPLLRWPIRGVVDATSQNGPRPMTYAFLGIARIILEMTRAEEPKGRDVRHSLELLVREMEAQRQRVVARIEEEELTWEVRMIAAGEAFNFHESIDFVLKLFAYDDASLRTLRVCGYESCTRPFFIDTSSSGTARFCSVKHRVAQHRAAKDTPTA